MTNNGSPAQPTDPNLAAALNALVRPGTQEQLCGREYLREDDFWSKEWGKQPPFFEEEDSEWF